MIAGKNRGESNLPTEEDRKKRALDYLSRDPLLHMGMIRSVRNGSAKLLRVSGKGVLLYNTAGHITMASAADEEEADRIAAACQAGGLCVAHQKFLADRLRDRFGFAENMECRQAAYLKRGAIPVPESPAVLRPLDERFLPFVRERYRLEDYGGYLAELLRAGGMLGAFVGGDPLPAGFVGRHAEGTVGMLLVRPEYRRRGVGLALEVSMVDRVLAAGEVPFGQIAVGNAASMRLQEKLGFAVSKSTLFWLAAEEPG